MARFSRKQRGGQGSASGSRKPSSGSRKASGVGILGVFSRLTKRVKNALTKYETKINRIFENEEKRHQFLKTFSGTSLYVPKPGGCTKKVINEEITSVNLIKYMKTIEESSLDCRNNEMMRALYAFINKVY